MEKIRRRRRGYSYPKSLLEERGELDYIEPNSQPVEKSAGVYSPPPGSLQGTTGLGLPDVDSRVLSTYDIRPINARDFLISTVADAALGDSSAFFQVPQGYTMVIREFSFQVGVFNSGTASFTPSSGLLVTNLQFFVDGIEYPYLLPVNDGSGNPRSNAFDSGVSRQKTHIIAASGSKIEFRPTQFGVAKSILMDVWGQLLLNRGLPTAYEIGSAGSGLGNAPAGESAAPAEPTAPAAKNKLPPRPVQKGTSLASHAAWEREIIEWNEMRTHPENFDWS